MSGAPVVLVVLDGWGIAPPGPGNAVDLAQTPVFDALWKRWPHTTLEASGRAVGLPDGQMGNSEVGHTNLGAGRVVRQDLVRIDDDIETGAFGTNPAFQAAFEHARGSALHLLGLVSDGGVHSHVRHLQALIAAARDGGRRPGARARVHRRPRCVAHQRRRLRLADPRDRDARGPLLGDGSRPPLGSASSAPTTPSCTASAPWPRTPVEAVRQSYEAGVTDEFIEPTIIGEPAHGRIRAGDAAIFFNFRPDRARELTRALIEPEFDDFDRGPHPPLPYFVQMTEYAEDIHAPVAYPAETVDRVLADVLSAAGVQQLHVAETEKYPHVTYFFDGGSEHRRSGEDWELVASRRDVATYDQAPQMSAEGITDVLVDGLAAGGLGFALINYANPDMVGHTGVIPAVIEAVETADRCLGRLLAAVAAAGGTAVVTADHGNAEQMLEPDGSPHTAHTTNPVPFVVTREGLALRSGGRLADVAPTVLDLLGLEQPEQMERAHPASRRRVILPLSGKETLKGA